MSSSFRHHQIMLKSVVQRISVVLNEVILNAAEIHYLTPSASEWDRYPKLGGLGYPHNDFHAHVLTHEYFNLVMANIHRWKVPGWVPGMSRSLLISARADGSFGHR